MITDKPIANQGLRISWVLCAFGVVLVCLGVFISRYEVHNAANMEDVDWFGRHVCPVARFKELNNRLPLAVKRPNEDQLWTDRLALEVVNWPGDSSILNKLNANESHYRIEVRRSILEFEAGRPLCMPLGGPLRVSPTYDEMTGVPFFGGPDMISFPGYAHNCGRKDVLNWYAKRGQFTVNSIKSAALTSRSTRTQPWAAAVML